MVIIAFGILFARPHAFAAAAASGPVFTITLAPGVAMQAHNAAEQPRSDSLDGRVYVIVSRHAGVEPRLQGPPGMDLNAPPIWGLDVDGLHTGSRVELGVSDPRVYGFPLAALKELPEGTYFVQAFMNVYETFHRSDGSTVKLHLPCGDGHRIMWSTGNIYSDVKKINVTRGGEPIELELSHVIPAHDVTPPAGTCQQGNLPQSQHVKFVKMKSERLSHFWGRPMYVAATVILPKDYEDHPDVRYPVIFWMEHHPRAYSVDGNESWRLSVWEDGRDTFSRWWLGANSPRVIVVLPLSETPYYDTSYWVNSPNVGPYGDVLTQELLPEINRQFRTIDAPSARTLTGCSSGGWMAAAPQVFYPDLFGGAFIFSPDVVDLRSFWLINLYKDDNAYWNQSEWRRWPRPYIRDKVGNTSSTTADWAHLELAMGNKSRSGGYFGQLDATWGPQGADGYPVPRWDPLTGRIDRVAVQQYRNYDLSAYLETNWATLEPKLRGRRLQFFVTEDDNFYYNLAVHLLEQRVSKLTPAADAQFKYFPSGGHCGAPITNQKLLERMAKFMTDHTGAGGKTSELPN
jgi:S-formylglutathione hydrolase FrmB